MANITVFTVAFAFAGPDVLLIRKAKPEWQKGYLNGIGGKLEGAESVLDATVREFKEETGLYSYVIEPVVYHALAWKEYVTHHQPVVYFSAFELPKEALFEACRNTADSVEPCVIWKRDKVTMTLCPCMPNLPFLIEMAECLVLCPPEDRKLRQPIIFPPHVYADNINERLE